MNTLENKNPLKWRTYIGASSRVVTLALMTTLFFGTPNAFAAPPEIHLGSTISNGALSPTLSIVGANFAADNDKFDFTVDVGVTGLEFDSVAFVNSTHMRFTFHETAKAGTITIQANASAFNPVASEPSNTLTIIVPAALISQVITFKAPTAMSVKDKDQIPTATSSSGLEVTLFSNTPSVCTIDFLKIHSVAAGTCSIKASQSGDSVFAPALDVVKTLIISTAPLSNTEKPTSQVDAATALGLANYDPNVATGKYVAVLVAGSDTGSKSSTLVKLLIPPRATDGNTVFLISAFSSDKETAAGHFVARIKAVASDGTAVSRFKRFVEINIPAGATGITPSWSNDGLRWHKLQKINTEVMPTDLHAAYFVEKDGRIAIFTDYLMLFGFRKAQASLTITSSVLELKELVQTTLGSRGGSGIGILKFFTATPTICSVSETGTLTGLTEGRCLVAARKDGSQIYLDSISSAITIWIEPISAAVSDEATSSDYDLLCHEITYSLSKSSSTIDVVLCKDDAHKVAYLETGTKSKDGTWTYKRVARAVLDDKSRATYKLTSVITAGTNLRVIIDGVVHISTMVSSK